MLAVLLLFGPQVAPANMELIAASVEWLSHQVAKLRAAECPERNGLLYQGQRTSFFAWSDARSCVEADSNACKLKALACAMAFTGAAPQNC